MELVLILGSGVFKKVVFFISLSWHTPWFLTDLIALFVHSDQKFLRRAYFEKNDVSPKKNLSQFVDLPLRCSLDHVVGHQC